MPPASSSFAGPTEMRALTDALRPGQRVFVAGLTAESALLRAALEHAPERADGVEFTSIQLPGVDHTDYLGLHPRARTQAFFMTPQARAGLATQRCTLHAMDYSGIARHLRSAAPFDCAIGQFTPPDAQGWCHPGLNADFLPLVWSRALRRVGHLNPALPRLDSPFKVHISDFDAVAHAQAPLLQIADAPVNSVGTRIGQHVAPLVQDGDTLQFGIGAVMQAVANALVDHRHLRLHTGMVSTLLRTLWDSGALDRDAPIHTGVVFGDDAFYGDIAALGRVVLHDVRFTHGAQTLAGLSRLVAINSAVEVDLFGQVNSERSDGTLQAGAGGLPAFAQASQQSADGRLLVCLPATARQGQVSRIVPSLGPRSLCTVPRYLSDAVVTEFGVAQLHGLSVQARAQALIAIAAPEHRPALAAAWDAIAAEL
jgi:acyl-CoA hydrolase